MDAMFTRTEEDRLDYLENLAIPLQVLARRDLQMIVPCLLVMGSMALGVWLLRR